MRTPIALLVLLLPAGVQAETLVVHCSQVSGTSCVSGQAVWAKPVDAKVVRVLRGTTAPFVALETVLPTERIYVCVDDPALAAGTVGTCVTRVPGRTDNWQLKSLVYPTPEAPAGPTWTGSATISWQPPVTNTDGSALTDLAGHHIDFGVDPAQLTRRVTVPGAGIARYTLTGLEPGRYYLGMRAYTTAGAESGLSNVIDIAIVDSQPACTAKPADETRTNQCAEPTIGSWTQTRAFASVAYPTCWAPGEWLPASAPAGACTSPWRVAPISSGTRPVYEPVANLTSTATVRGTVQGKVAVGTPCGEQRFKSGANSYRTVAESDIALNSPTYQGREHVAICVQE